MNTNIITQGRAKVVGPEFKTSLRKTMIVLAAAAALTGGLTADAFARGGGGGVDTAADSAVALIWAAGSAAALTWAAALALAISAVMAGLSAAAGVLRPAWVTASIPTGAATATPITIPTAALRTDVRQHQRPRLCYMRIKPRIVLAGPVP